MMKKTVNSIICLCLCVILLASSMPVYAESYSAKQSSSMPFVVSLGDSFSAGESIEPYYDQYTDTSYKYTSEDWIAHRSTLAWPGLLEINGVRLNEVRATNLSVSEGLHPAKGVENGSWYFAAVSGATSEHIYSENDENRQDKTVVHAEAKTVVNERGEEETVAEILWDSEYVLNFQIDAITSLPDPSTVDYVTLTIGGNDMGFVEVVKQAIFGSNLVNMSMNGLRGDLLYKIQTFWETGDDSTPMADKLENTYRKILEEAPSATLIVAGYPQLLQFNSGGPIANLGISPEEAKLIYNAVSIFNGYLEKIISTRMKGYHVEFVDVQKTFEEYAEQTDEPLLNGLVLLDTDENIDNTGLMNAYVSSASFHPTEYGAQAYASAVQDVLDQLVKERQGTYDNDETDAYQVYQKAIQATTSTGSWNENLTMTADMTITQGKSKVKTKATIASVMNVDNCFEDDLSNATMSGSGSMSVMGQSYAWNVVYENGIAHFEYTEPNITSVDIEMDISCFDFDTLTEDMMNNAKLSGNKITFKISGVDLQEAGIAAVNLMPGIENLEYGDVDVEVLINKETGIISEVVMGYHASLTYQGYDAEADYYIDYTFSQ